jgi:hypothetical protein
LDGVQPPILTLAKPSEVEQSPITQIEGRIGSSALTRYNDYVATTSATSFSAFFAAYNLLLLVPELVCRRDSCHSALYGSAPGGSGFLRQHAPDPHYPRGRDDLR